MNSLRRSCEKTYVEVFHIRIGSMEGYHENKKRI